jgi:hypothetical protein
MLWRILEHVALIASLGFNVFLLVHLALLYRLPQFLREPAFPNQARDHATALSNVRQADERR